MKDRYRLFLRRKSVFYAFDTETNRFESLRTRDRTEARKLLHVRHAACRQPQMNVQLARVYLQHSDPAVATRRWQSVMEEIVQTKTGENRSRWDSSLSHQLDERFASSDCGIIGHGNLNPKLVAVTRSRS
jgi:hypothetical protein